jgi:hypothetical protein
MNRRNLINGVAVKDTDGTWVLFREADALLKKREQTIISLNKKVNNLKRQVRRKRKEYKLRTNNPFYGRVKLTIQVRSNKTYAMSTKALIKKL